MEYMVYWFFYGIVWRLAYEYPYVLAVGLALWIFRDRIPNPLRVWRRRQRIERLEDLIRLNPENAEDRMELADLLIESGRPAGAVPHLEAAARKAPDSPGAQFLLGVARLRTGAPAEAITALEEARRLAPEYRYGEVLLRLGEALTALGRTAEAAAALEAHVAVNASSAEGLYRLAAIRVALGDTRGALRAVEDLRATLHQSPRFRRKLDRPWLRRAERLDLRAA